MQLYEAIGGTNFLRLQGSLSGKEDRLLFPTEGGDTVTVYETMMILLTFGIFFTDFVILVIVLIKSIKK